MNQPEQTDPRRILLNACRFRGKLHIYEIAQTWDRSENRIVYLIRKQVTNQGSRSSIQDVNKTEPFTEIEIQRDDVAEVFELARNLTLPACRTGHAGKDGEWYGMRFGVRPCMTSVTWWSDSEPELKPLFTLRDKITATINQLVQSRNDSFAR